MTPPNPGSVSSETVRGGTAVIVLNYDGEGVIARCLEGLLEQSRKPDEIIVVDNCSRDSSPQIIRQQFPQVRLIELDRNHMFSGGNNIGLENTGCEFVAFLNNDCFPHPEWLSSMVRSMTDGVGAVASSMRMLDNPELMDSAGGTVDELGHTIDRGYGRPCEEFGDTCEVFFPCGGAFLLRRSALEGETLFWRDLEFYCEDADLGWRLWRSGWRVVYQPGAVVVHHHSHSFGGMPFLKERLLARNRIMLLRRHLSRGEFRRLMPWILLWQKVRILKNLLRLRPGLSLALSVGLLSGLLKPVERVSLTRTGRDSMSRFLPDEPSGGALARFVKRRARRALRLL